MALSPSILNADLSSLKDEVRRIEHYVRMIHLDVMDGHFVPNITFGPQVIAALRKHTQLFFDTHLMIANPDQYVKDFIDAGSNMVTIHAEATKDLPKSISLIKHLGAHAGVAINPETKIETILPHLFSSEIDRVLIMTVQPGFGGQKFNSAILDKIAAAREFIDAEDLQCEIAVDGGINATTLPLAKETGADVFVVGSAIFDGKDPAGNVQRFLELLK